MNALAPCPGCQRHVRTGSLECPFCSAALDGIPVPKRPILFGRHRRNAVLFMGATIAALGASCSDDSDGDGGGKQALDSGTGGSSGASSGGSGGTSTGGSSGATTGGSGGVGGPQDEGGLVDAYGTPDVGLGGSAGGPVDEGGGVDAYGTPDF